MMHLRERVHAKPELPMLRHMQKESRARLGESAQASNFNVVIARIAPREYLQHVSNSTSTTGEESAHISGTVSSGHQTP